MVHSWQEKKNKMGCGCKSDYSDAYDSQSWYSQDSYAQQKCCKKPKKCCDPCCKPKKCCKPCCKPKKCCDPCCKPKKCCDPCCKPDCCDVKQDYAPYTPYNSWCCWGGGYYGSFY